MQTYVSFPFWYGLLAFLFSTFFVFFIPGFFLTRRVQKGMPALVRLVLSVAVGLCLWGIQGYVLGYLQVRSASYLYVVLAVFLFWWLRKELAVFGRTLWQAVGDLDRGAVVILCLGVVVQVLQMVGSGIATPQGMPFFRVHVQDGIYHLSMIESIVRQFPPMEPGAAGIAVSNYHYWSDMIMADVARVFHISIPLLFFQYVPVFLSLLIGFSLVALLTSWKSSRWFIRFALFFLFFGADAGYVISYLIHHVVSFQYPVIDNGATQFLNMPHSFAKFIFFCQIMTVGYWVRTKKLIWGGFTGLFTALLFGLKIYFALFSVLGLAVVFVVLVLQTLYALIRRQRVQVSLLGQFVLVGVLAALAAALIYLPPNKGSGGLAYYPLEWPKLMLAEDNLDWRDWRYKIAVANLTHQQSKVMFYEAEAIVVTLIAIHGTRLLGFLVTRKMGKQWGWELTAYLLVPSVIFTYLGLYTLQVSGNFNVFNFFAMSLSVLAIVAAFHMSQWWESRNVVLRGLVVLIVLLTLPRIFFETEKILASYAQGTDVAYISVGEQIALSYIQTHFPQNCSIAVSPANALDMKTPYVSFFSNHPTYMSGQTVLETHNAPTTERYQQYRLLFQSNDAGRIRAELQKVGVCALYLKPSDPLQQNQVFRERIAYTNDAGTVVDLR